MHDLPLSNHCVRILLLACRWQIRILPRVVTRLLLARHRGRAAALAHQAVAHQALAQAQALVQTLVQVLVRALGRVQAQAVLRALRTLKAHAACQIIQPAVRLSSLVDIVLIRAVIPVSHLHFSHAQKKLS